MAFQKLAGGNSRSRLQNNEVSISGYQILLSNYIAQDVLGGGDLVEVSFDPDTSTLRIEPPTPDGKPRKVTNGRTITASLRSEFGLDILGGRYEASILARAVEIEVETEPAVLGKRGRPPKAAAAE